MGGNASISRLGGVSHAGRDNHTPSARRAPSGLFARLGVLPQYETKPLRTDGGKCYHICVFGKEVMSRPESVSNAGKKDTISPAYIGLRTRAHSLPGTGRGFQWK